MKKRLKKKIEKRLALFKENADNRAIGHTQRLVAARQRTQSNTHRKEQRS
ncbi:MULTISPECIES: hypothetical protein [Bacillus]|nr:MULTISPECIES: hypothetical protein [Bacillus]